MQHLLENQVKKLIESPDRTCSLGVAAKKNNGWGFFFWASRAVESPAVSTTVDQNPNQSEVYADSIPVLVHDWGNVPQGDACGKANDEGKQHWVRTRPACKKCVTVDASTSVCDGFRLQPCRGFPIGKSSFKPFCHIKTAPTNST